MSQLLPLSKLLKKDEESKEDLSKTISLLFETSASVTASLTPNVHQSLLKEVPESYNDAIDRVMEVISSWSNDRKADFISGHPRIGEVNNLSALSAAEQAAKATPAPVLARLAHLNQCYEKRYPGLRFITFVAGRSRADIVPEMEMRLRMDIGRNEDGEVEGGETESVNLSPMIEDVVAYEVGADEWMQELERAVEDIGKIAKNRAEKLTAV
jgi:2-oxo-4-hydroxy-4-carboxy--5-ureidoimidazoline (OHCU) decarboxylase